MKYKIRIRIKFALLEILVAVGFLFLYTYLWLTAGLPETWWAMLILAVLSSLSSIGILAWIGKEDHIPVRCSTCRHWVRHEPGEKIGTCFCRGFNHGVYKQENGYCDRGEPFVEKESS